MPTTKPHGATLQTDVKQVVYFYQNSVKEFLYSMLLTIENFFDEEPILNLSDTPGGQV